LKTSLSGRVEYVFVFSAFLIVRAVPEIFTAYPSGWDLINYYAPWTLTFAKYGAVNLHFFTASPLIFTLLVMLYQVIADVFLTLKMIVPILYGVVGVSFLYFLRNYLNWNKEKRIFGSIFLMCQLGALRISWDLLKNEVAIAILFVLLVSLGRFLKENASSKRCLAEILIFSLLLAFSHQYVLVIYMITALYVTLKLSRKRQKYSFIAANVPAFVILLIMLFISKSALYIAENPFAGGTVSFGRTVHFVDAPTFAVFIDYLKMFPSYEYLAGDILLVFTFLYIWFIILVIFGFWHDYILTPVTVSLLVAGFMPLISPNFAIFDWYRWMFMLCYPFAIYATNGLYRNFDCHENFKTIDIFSGKYVKRILKFVKDRLRICLVVGLLLTYSAIYVKGDLYGVFPSRAWSYFPTSMIDWPSSNKTIFSDIVNNIDFVNQFYVGNMGPFLKDDFEGAELNTSLWNFIGTGSLSIENSTMTLNTETFLSNAYIEHNWRRNLKGSIELKFKFNKYVSETSLLDIIFVRDFTQTRGGVFYCNLNKSFSYWDSENDTCYDLAPLDNKWHTLKIICDGNGRTIYLDEQKKLELETGKFFGNVALGENAMLESYGGSSSFDYISCTYSPLNASVIISNEEIGITMMYLDQKITIVVFGFNVSAAVNYAFEQKFSYVFFLTKGNFWLEKSGESYQLTYKGICYSVYLIQRMLLK
jgi:hypothetical protein